MGWNTVEGKGLLFKDIDANSHFYMVHSFYAVPNDNVVGACTYDVPFAAALAKDNFYGTQFHPEADSASALDAKIFEEFVVGITGEIPAMRLVA